MFLLYKIEKSPLDGNKTLVIHSPRCKLKCKNCIIPIKTEKEYMKLDVIALINEHRNSISSVTLNLCGMTQLKNVTYRYLSLIRARWGGLKRYVSFCVPHIPSIWLFMADNLLDGIIYTLPFPLFGSETTPFRYMKYTGCSDTQYLSSVYMYLLLKENRLPISSTIIHPPYISSLTNKEINWINTSLRSS